MSPRQVSQKKRPIKLAPTEEIVEAKAWFVGANGNIVLTANPGQLDTFRNSRVTPYFCTQ